MRYWKGFLLLVSYALLFNSCIMKTSSKDIYVYHVINGSHGYEKVEGLALLGDRMYYYPADSMLMTYDNPVNRFEENDTILHKYLTQITSLDSIDDPINEYCLGVTKNEFIVRVRSKGNREVLQEFVIAEYLDCDEKSVYHSVGYLSKFFRMKSDDKK